MFKESKKMPGPVETKIRFDEETICALGRAFKMNHEVVRELTEIVGEEKMKVFTDILGNTIGMEIKDDPSDELKIVYSQVAKRELERIDAEDEDDDDLICGHSIDEHKEALESVLEIMEPKVN